VSNSFTLKKPEELELEKKLSDFTSLESDLIQKELELTTLQGELQAFETLYLRVVGIKIVQLDEILAQVSEALAKSNQNNKSAIHNAEQARTRADESAQSAQSINMKAESQKEFKPSDNLKSLYREAAKRFHPDFAIDDEDRKRRTILMREINAAYKAGDEVKLLRIIKEWEDSPESIVGDDIGAKLIRTIRKTAQIQNRLSALLEEINNIKSTDLYKLRIRVQKAENENKDLLQEMASKIDMQIAEQQKILDGLLEIIG